MRETKRLPMKLKASRRIIWSTLRERHPKETYWSMRRCGDQLLRLLRPSNRTFARTVAKDIGNFVIGVQPEVGNTHARARAAVSWLLRAQEVTGIGGVALGYFPCIDGP